MAISHLNGTRLCRRYDSGRPESRQPVSAKQVASPRAAQPFPAKSPIIKTNNTKSLVRGSSR